MNKLDAVFRGLLSVSFISGLTSGSWAAPICSSEIGSCFEVVNANSITWSEARAAAELMNYDSVQGHLATIRSQAENDFITTKLALTGYEYWLGGFQPPGSPEPMGNWQWITGEPFDFTHWNGGEPNDAGGIEDNLAVLAPSGMWNDEGSAPDYISGYVVEFPVGAGLAFSVFTPRAEFKLGPKANDDSYWLRGWLKLADTSNGIDLLTESVTIKVGSFSHTIPAGSFLQEGGAYKYVGAVGPAKLDVAFWPQAKAGTYWFKSCLKNGSLGATTMRPQVRLSIGDDQGQATLDVGYAKFGKGSDGQKWVFPQSK